MFTSRLEGWIDSLHTHIETDDEEVEVQTDAQSVADGQLFPELTDFKFSSRLYLVFP